MPKDCHECTGEQELMVGGARHVLDPKVENQVQVVQCSRCGSVHYRMPPELWAEVEEDAALERGEVRRTDRYA